MTNLLARYMPGCEYIDTGCASSASVPVNSASNPRLNTIKRMTRNPFIFILVTDGRSNAWRTWFSNNQH